MEGEPTAPTGVEAGKINNNKKRIIIVAFLIMYGALIISLIIWLFSGNSTRGSFDKLQSPPVIILAIVISVLTFTASSSVFSALGKSNENAALGMPDGSIRALIALTLITLFFILATEIYSKVSDGGISRLERLSEQDLKQFSIKDLISKQAIDSLSNPAYDTLKASDSLKRASIPRFNYLYNVTVRVASNTEASDMAKTVIASFTSLIAAICGFYFGSGASKQTTETIKQGTDLIKQSAETLKQDKDVSKQTADASKQNTEALKEGTTAVKETTAALKENINVNKESGENEDEENATTKTE